jgi:hypothetical protein
MTTPQSPEASKGTPMLAYHNGPALKTAILSQLQAHHDADQIVKGRYWEDGKGCAVGCTIHSGDHAEYEVLFGIPIMLAWLEDTIFEGLPNDLAQTWPMRFMSAIRPGADLSRVGWKLLHFILEGMLGQHGPEIDTVLRGSMTVLESPMNGLEIDRSAAARAWSAAAAEEEAAAAAAEAAWSAAWSAAAAARAAEAAWSAAAAAEAAWSAAAEAAWSAAWSAAAAARAAEAAASLAASYVRYSNRLVELLDAA